MTTKPDDDALAGMTGADGVAKMFQERTVAETVADIVAADPAKHSISLEERQRRALLQAKAQAKADAEFFNEGEDGEDDNNAA